MKAKKKNGGGGEVHNSRMSRKLIKKKLTNENSQTKQDTFKTFKSTTKEHIDSEKDKQNSVFQSLAISHHSIAVKTKYKLYYIQSSRVPLDSCPL